jgi:hypothetical protein
MDVICSIKNFITDLRKRVTFPMFLFISEGSLLKNKAPTKDVTAQEHQKWPPMFSLKRKKVLFSRFLNCFSKFGLRQLIKFKLHTTKCDLKN